MKTGKLEWTIHDFEVYDEYSRARDDTRDD